MNEEKMYGRRKAHMSEEELEAYECGREDGYAEAMKKVYGERDPYMGERMPYIAYRDDDDMYMGERRRRDSMGRYRR